jgi:VWFA-related protein
LFDPHKELTQHMMIYSRFKMFMSIALLCASAAAAQQPPAQTTQPPDDSHIRLDVVVAPKDGAPVRGLRQQDFTVLDNKTPQTITSFKEVSGREAPIEVTIVIDAINTGPQLLGYEREQVQKFLAGEGGRLPYPTAVVVVADKNNEVVGGFTTDGNALSAAVQKSDFALRIVTRSQGYYGAADRLQISIDALRRIIASENQRPGRKLVLWVSPGWALLSGPNTELDAKQEQGIFDDVVGISTALRQARITLFNVNPVGTTEPIGFASYYEEFLKGVSKPSQVHLGDLALQVLAVQSGGLTITLNSDVSGTLRQSIDNSTPYYEISYAAPAAAKPNEYHHIEIKMAKSGLVARTRQGYYAQPAH